MIRGTTPHYTLTIEGYDLTEMTVFVTIRRGDYSTLTLTNDRLTIGYADNTSSIGFTLTQEETLMLREGVGKVQVRFINADGDAQATEIGSIWIYPVLLEKKISFEGV